MAGLKFGMGGGGGGGSDMERSLYSRREARLGLQGKMISLTLWMS